MEGDLSVCSLGDLLHIVSAREKAARIEFLREGEAIGYLVVHGPLVLESFASGLSGDAAIFHLWHQRMFRFRVLPNSAPTSPLAGGETPEAGEGTTIWVLTRRDGAKGIGWACLAALSRALGSSPAAEAVE